MENQPNHPINLKQYFYLCKNLVKYFIYILILGCSQSVFAQAEQGTPNKKAFIVREMDHGVALMEEGKYEEADVKFKYVLQNLTPLPSNMAFFIGKNSFYLQRYKQSINWLNKYISLKGTQGTHYQEAISLQREAESLFMLKKEQDSTAYIGTDTLFTHNYIDCGKSGKILCPICKGQTVIIEKGVFGDTYKTCPYSDSKGMLTCDEYNLLIQGKLEPKRNN